MEPNIKEIKETLLNNIELISKQTNIGIQELRSAAANFLNQLKQIYFNASLVATSNQDEKKMRLWNIYRDNETAQTIALAQHNFSIYLDKFLNRRIILTYVNKDGQVLFYDEKQETQILNAVRKNKGRQNFKQSEWIKQSKQIKDPPYAHFTQEEQDLISNIEKEVRDKQKVYQVALERYNKTKKEKKEKKYYWTYNSLKRIYTETEFSIGEMAEGYVTALAVGKEDTFSSPEGENIETPLEQLYNNYIKSQKDSLGAIISGDVVLTEDGKISLAVKTKAASTAKIGQYIVAAYQILNQSDLTEKDISEEWLTKLPKIDKLSEQIYKESGKELEIYLEEWLKQFNLN